MTKTAVNPGADPAEGLGANLGAEATGEGLHVNYPRPSEKPGEGGMIELTGIPTAYMHRYVQPGKAWTLEPNVRTHKENF